MIKAGGAIADQGPGQHALDTEYPPIAREVTNQVDNSLSYVDTSLPLMILFHQITGALT